MLDYKKINFENTINSGQVFLWKKFEGIWYGINGQDILRVTKEGRIKSIQNNNIDFFRNEDDIKKIIKSISKDNTIKLAVKKYLGLRILRQDPFQCLISFIASSNSNIQKIRTCLEKLSEKFGDKIEFDNRMFHLFPEPDRISKLTINQINSCGFGYRSKFVINAAKMIMQEQIDLEYLKKSNYTEAKEVIQSVPGVGSKVADCVLLFSLDKLDAFPLDRWMIRILNKYYHDKFNISTKTITEKQYNILHEKIVNYFGDYAGYAQQFLFKMERENFQKKWL